jgi:hypothetical protein
MAWTTPKTWASGYVVLAADLNTHLRDNLNVTAPAVMTTAGDVIYASGANTPARLAKSTTSTQYLANTGGSNIPEWNEVALDTGVSGTLPVANGGVGVALSAPGADRILFWDHSATAYAYLTAGTNLTISGTTMVSAGLAAVVDDTSPQLGGNLDMQARLLVGNGGSTGIAISANGEVVMAAQPAFFAHNSTINSNQTGNGTDATVEFDTVVFDQGGDFNNSTDTFTAPVAGRYLLTATVLVTGMTAAMTSIRIRINASNRFAESYLNGGDAINQGPSVATVIDMDASDTATVKIRVLNGAGDTADIAGSSTEASTHFSGCLLA